jgi:hypothetical protein
MDRIIFLISGYKKTGKDTSGREFKSGHFEHHWLIYVAASEAHLEPERFNRLTKSLTSAKLLAFAMPIRQALQARFNLPPDYDWDANKDSAIFEGKLLREHMIAYAQEKRKQDKGYFAKEAFASLLAEGGGSAIVTDFRFPEELYTLSNKAKLITVRLFRAAAVPPMSANPETDTEHQLDNTALDYLLVPAVADFAVCAKFLPVYARYVCVGTI